MRRRPTKQASNSAAKRKRAADQTRSQVNDAAEQVRERRPSKKRPAERTSQQGDGAGRRDATTAQQTADTMLTRVRDTRENFLTSAAGEMGRLRVRIAAISHRAEA